MIFQPHTYSIQSDPKNALERISNDIFEGDEYFPAFGGKVIVDVGACIGLFSMYAYKFAKQIYAVEPHPTSYANLTANVQNNHLDKIKTYNLAIARQNGEGWIHDNSVLEGSTFGFDTGTYKVKALTLATFFKENAIEYADIVKIDTEGSEQEIFRAEDILEVKNKIGTIIMEVHSAFDCPFKEWKCEQYGKRIFTFHK